MTDNIFRTQLNWRYLFEVFTVTEDLLVLQPLKRTTTGQGIFNEVQKAFKSFGLPLSRLVGVCTDGAPSMVGLHEGFIGISNEKATELNVQKNDLILHYPPTELVMGVHSTPECYKCGSKNYQFYSIPRT